MIARGSGSEPRALLLTGSPGVGKTTIVQKVAAGMAAGTVRGFFTEEIREGGARKGFKLIPFSGEPLIMAHVEHASRHRVSRYGVDVAMLERTVPSLLQLDPQAELYVIDEIGKMECFSERFVASARRLLDERVLMVATVAQRGGGFIAEVKERSDVAVWRVTHANRETLPAEVIDWVRARSGGESVSGKR